MKIVQLVDRFGVGGLPNYVVQLSQLLKSAGHNVTVAYSEEGPAAHLETAGLQLVHAQQARDLMALKPDLIHVHVLRDTAYVQELHRLGVPLLRSFHDYTSTCLRLGKRRFPGDRCQRALGYSCAAFGCLVAPPAPGSSSRLPRLMNLPDRILERNLYRDFDAAICGSYHMQAMLQKNGFAENKLHRIPYFSKFEDEAHQPVQKAGGAGTTRPFELLFSGQAIKGKGLEVLIAALPNLPQNWRLTVFAEGPRLEAAKEQARQTGIFERITFCNWVGQSELREAYRNADLFILPSIWDDPGPLVGIEALACGTPVLGFAVGGIPDYVIEGETGFLVHDVSAEGLGNGLKQALSDANHLASMTPNCKNRVKNHHSAAAHLAQIEPVYRNLVPMKEGVSHAH